MFKYTKHSPSARRNKRLTRRRLMLALLGLVFIGAGLFVLERRGLISLPFSDDNQPVISPDGINYGPPTEQEKAETQDFKEGLGEETKPPDSPPTTSPAAKKSVTPIMTSWGASPDAEARGYIPGITEEGGTCTLTLTKGNQKVTESKAATPDATTVSCGLISIARNRLSAGTWAATLSYSSASSEGVSTSNSIEVE